MIEEWFLLQDQMKGYTNNVLSGSEIVKVIDDFVSNDHVYSLPENMYKKVMELQDKVAFYVSDPRTRKEHSSYFGDERLRIMILQFLKEINT